MILFKDLVKGSALYALVKKDGLLEYKEGKLISVGIPRVEMKTEVLAAPRTVVDVTYSFEGVDYTDAVDVNAPFFSTKNFGALSLVATETDTILKELRATLSSSEQYIKDSETEIPNSKKRIIQCKELIGKLDTSYAEKQAIEQRIVKLEEQGSETNKLLSQILKKLDKS